MQAKNLSGGQELLCINTTKVYDWIMNDATFDTPINLVLADIGQGVTCAQLATATVTCEVDNVTATELDREDVEFVIDGTLITLQLVTLQKSFDVTLYITLAGSTTPIEEGPYTFSRTEQVILCAPEDTTVTVDFTNVDCFVSPLVCPTEGATSVTATPTVRLCQSIQSTFPVTLELVADFCSPREILPINTACTAPIIPPQCPVLFPTTSVTAK